MTSVKLDNPHVRASETCPLCSWPKDRGCLACWRCYSEGGMRYGNPEIEAKIAARERFLCGAASEPMINPGTKEWLDAKRGGPRWAWQDARGVWQEGYMETFSDR